MESDEDEPTQEPDYRFGRTCGHDCLAQCGCKEFAKWAEDTDEENNDSQKEVASTSKRSSGTEDTEDTKTPKKGDQPQPLTKKRRLHYCTPSPRSKGDRGSESSPELEKDNSESNPTFPDELSPLGDDEEEREPPQIPQNLHENEEVDFTSCADCPKYERGVCSQCALDNGIWGGKDERMETDDEDQDIFSLVEEQIDSSHNSLPSQETDSFQFQSGPEQQRVSETSHTKPPPGSKKNPIVID